MDCRQARIWMHEYLDGELSEEALRELREHAKDCEDCRKHYQQLSRTAAIVRSLPSVPAPSGLKDRIMAGLPPEPAAAPTKPAAPGAPAADLLETTDRRPVRRGAAKRANWFRRHPGLSVAVLFALVMGASYLAMQGQGDELIVRGSHLESLVIEDHRVVVPADSTVGDLTVKNGEVWVDGKVDGNLVVIDGSYKLASTAQIAGDISQIDQTLDRIWFTLKRWFSKLG